jgi:hypothetical protein
MVGCHLLRAKDYRIFRERASTKLRWLIVIGVKNASNNTSPAYILVFVIPLLSDGCWAFDKLTLPFLLCFKLAAGSSMIAITLSYTLLQTLHLVTFFVFN